MASHRSIQWQLQMLEKKPLKVVRSELTEKARNDQRRGSRGLVEDLKNMDRAQKVFMKEVKQEKNSLQCVSSKTSGKLRSSIYDRPHKEEEYKSIFRTRPGEPGLVDESRVQWGSGAVDVPSSPSLNRWGFTPPTVYGSLSKRALGKFGPKSSH